MTKRLVEIADEDLAAAREALGTTTIRETVTEALRTAARTAARRREVDRLTSGLFSELAEPSFRDKAWR